MTVILLIKTEDGEVTELPILNKIILGRSGSSDFKIADSKMSSSHCSFEVNKSGQLLFTDLGSSNGSFINNSQVTQTFVRINDVVRIGNTLIKLEEKRLGPSERLAIGISTSKNTNDKTLPEVKPKNESSKEKLPTKKAILLDSAHKEKKKVSSNWAGADNVIDQEESSGNTKFLELNKPSRKK